MKKQLLVTFLIVLCLSQIPLAYAPTVELWREDPLDDNLLDPKGWVYNEGNPVIAQPQAWCNRATEHPTIVQYNTTHWTMFIEGYNSSYVGRYKIGCFWSTDCENWTNHDTNPVFYPREWNLSLWDGYGVGNPALMKMNDTHWYMWYGGVTNIPDGKWEIGLAWTTHDQFPNGWTRYQEDPLLRVVAGTWEDDYVATPSVLRLNNGTYYMYYEGWKDISPREVAIGLATSNNGINWTKYAGNPIITTYHSNPEVWFTEDRYEIYTPNNWTDIDMYYSTDGITFIAYANNPVISNRGAGEWDDIWVCGQFPYKHTQLDRYYLYYQGRDSDKYNYEIGFYYADKVHIPSGYDPVFQSGMDLLFDEEVDRPHARYLFDTSPYRNHGIPNSEPTINWGKYGYALEFDGIDDYIEIPSTTELYDTPTNTWSMMAWVFCHNITGYHDIIRKHSASWGYHMRIHDGEFETLLRFDDGYEEVSNSSVTIQENVWYHLAMIYDGSTLFQYVNSELNGTWTFARTLNFTSLMNVTIGYSGNPAFGEYFDGIIDEVRISPTNIEQAYVKNLMGDPIIKFDQQWFTRSYTVGTGYVDGEINGYTDFVHNDPELPYTYTNATHNYTKCETQRYIPSFQSYRMYCTLEQSTCITTSESNILISAWSYTLFKRGKAQVRYLIKTSLYTSVNGSMTVYEIAVEMKQQCVGQSVETLQTEFLSYAQTSDNVTKFDLIVDAWVGSDQEHFTCRVTLDAENKSRTMVGLQYFPEFVWSSQYGFILQDKDGTPRNVDWFDGWVLVNLELQNGRYNAYGAGWETEWSISEHGLVMFIVLGVWGVLAGASLLQFVVFPYLEETFGWSLPDIPLIGGVASAVGGFIHGIISAFAVVLQPIINALQPLFDAIYGVGKIILDTIMFYLNELWLAILETGDWVAFQIWGVDNMFTHFINGAGMFLGQLGTLAGWFSGQIINFLNFLLSVGTNMITVIGNFLTFTVSSLANSTANISGQISSFFSLLGQFWEGTGIFENSIAFKDLWTVFMIGFLAFLGIGTATFGFGWLYDMMMKLYGILQFIGHIIMFGFNLLRKIVGIIGDIIPL